MIGDGKTVLSHCKYNVLSGGNNQWKQYYIFECMEFEVYSISLK